MSSAKNHAMWREQQARRWARNRNAAEGRIHGGIAKAIQKGVLLKPFAKARQGRRDI